MSDSVRPHRRQPFRLHPPWDSPDKNTGAGCHFLLQCIKVKSESEVAQSCPSLRDPMDQSLLNPLHLHSGRRQGAGFLPYGASPFTALNHILVSQPLFSSLSLSADWNMTAMSPCIFCHLKGRHLPWPCTPPALWSSLSPPLYRDVRPGWLHSLCLHSHHWSAMGSQFQFSKIPASGTMLTKRSSDLFFFFFFFNIN